MSHQDDTSEFGERLGDVEVTQWADLEEGDAQLLRVHLRLLRGHLPLVGQVEAVPDKDLGHPRGMLGKQEAEDCSRNTASAFLGTLGEIFLFALVFCECLCVCLQLYSYRCEDQKHIYAK